MSILNPINRDYRSRDIICAPNQTVFSLPVYVYDVQDIVVYKKQGSPSFFSTVASSAYTVAINPITRHATITFIVSPYLAVVPVVIRIKSARLASRVTDVTRNQVLVAKSLEKELDVQTTTDQELRRDIDEFALAASEIFEARDEAAASASEAAASALAAAASADETEGYAQIVITNQPIAPVPFFTVISSLTFPVGLQTIRTNGYYAVNDGGGATYKRLSAIPSPLKPWHVLSNGGAVAWQMLEREFIPQQFGAKGDGVTDDTAVFNAVPPELLGSRIDLKGFAYKVAAIPKNARYFNGDFVTPGGAVSLRRNPLDNPIDGNSIVAMGDGLQHYWCFDAITLLNKQVMALVKPAHRHDRSAGSPIFAMYSEDSGVTFSKQVTVHSYPDADIADLKIVDMGDRVGVLVTVIPFNTALSPRTDFWYTTELISTWTILENVAPYVFVYGPSQPLVSGTPGQSYICYGYASNESYSLVTNDKGLTWTRQTMSGLLGVEPYVVRVGTENKWIAFVRGAANLRISTSVDQVNWSALVDTGVPLGNHPVQAIVDRGRLFVYLFARDFTPATIEFENRCTVIEDDPQYVFANKMFKNKAGRTALKGANRSLGYMTIIPDGRAEDEFIYFVNASETDNSTTQPSVSHVYVGHTARHMMLPRSLHAGENLLHNPTFDFWDRGDSFPATGISTISTANRWRFNPSGSVANVEKVSLTMNQSKLLPFRGQYGYKITATAEDFIGLEQRHFNRDLFFKVQENTILFQIWGMGNPPNTLRFQCVRDADNGDAPVSASQLVVTTTQPANGIWKATARLVVVPIFSTLAAPKTVGANPSVTFSLSSFLSTAMDFTILGMKAELGQEFTPFAPTDVISERVKCANHMQVFSYDAFTAIANGYVLDTVTGEYFFEYPEMVKTPSVQFSAIGSNLTVYPQNQDVTALTASSVRRSSGILIATKSSSVLAFAPSFLRVKSGGSFKIYLECV
jgi:hypothetical protein